MEWQRDMQVLKLHEEQQVVRGVVLEPDVVDAQDDIMKAEEIEIAAHGFMIEVQKVAIGEAVDVDHREQADIVVVESFIAPVEFTEGGQTIRKGSWVLAVKVFDAEVWKSVKDGDRTAFSIHGKADRVPVAG